MNTTSSAAPAAPAYRTAYRAGLALNLFSFLIYIFGPRSSGTGDIFPTLFIINYAAGLVYLIGLTVNKFTYERPRPSIPLKCWINVVVLFTISSFSLNRGMDVFAVFPVWLNVMTLSMVFTFFLYPYINNLPAVLKGAIFFLSGTSLVLSIYMFVYLLPLAGIGLIVCFFFGISLHALIPAFWIWVIIDFFVRRAGKTKLKHLAWAGAAVPLVLLGIYLVRWNTIQKEIKDVIAERNLLNENQLPTDIYLAQKLPDDALTEEILVSPFKSQRFWEDGLRFLNNSEKRFHDPLSVVAIAFFDELPLDENTVVSLLNIRRDYRHKTTQTLWIGSNLVTSSVSNDIRVYPQYRLAYHEKTIVIHHAGDKAERNFWFSTRTQEALYTFHVPEGSIVTSLSLWVNGKEEKSRLTTLKKADSAYNNIVGVQMRDPAIVHWQEGNRVTVNIFPCTEKEDRTFKIGFTTPLALKNNSLQLENVWFEGPGSAGAREATSITFEGTSPAFIDVPEQFNIDKNGLNYKGEYQPSWEISFSAPGLSVQKFSFNGFDYKIAEMKENKISKKIEDVYLDINKEWTETEYNEILEGLSGKNIFAWTPKKMKIVKENKDDIWKALNDNQFSLPFLYNIKEPGNAVIITKSNGRSPLLAELKESTYAERTTQFLQKGGQINLINTGTALSPFWKSLAELGLANYQNTSINGAITQINNGMFTIAHEDSNVVALRSSHLNFIKTPADSLAANGNAPDHLLRIFAYNDVLRKIGGRYFQKENYEEILFREAEEGYVVTPVTSMIVLEKESDYDAAGVDKNVNTVGNAIVGGGAVPEPHEWVLIIMTILFIGWNIYRRKLKLNGAHSRL